MRMILIFWNIKDQDNQLKIEIQQENVYGRIREIILVNEDKDNIKNDDNDT